MSGSPNYGSVGQIQPVACFCKACELRTGFIFLKGCKNKNKEEYGTEPLCGQQSLKYLLTGPLQKRFC